MADSLPGSSNASCAPPKGFCQDQQECPRLFSAAGIPSAKESGGKEDVGQTDCSDSMTMSHHTASGNGSGPIVAKEKNSDIPVGINGDDTSNASQAKIKNRQAQRRFRERQKSLVDTLRSRVTDLVAQLSKNQEEMESMRDSNKRLRDEIDMMKNQRSRSVSVSSMPTSNWSMQQPTPQPLLLKALKHQVNMVNQPDMSNMSNMSNQLRTLDDGTSGLHLVRGHNGEYMLVQPQPQSNTSHNINMFGQIPGMPNTSAPSKMQVQSSVSGMGQGMIPMSQSPSLGGWNSLVVGMMPR